MCNVPVVGEGEIDSTEYSPSSLPSSSSSKHVQVLEVLLQPYKDAENRTQQVMRSKTIKVVEDCANKFVHYNAKDIPEFVNDLLNCKSGSPHLKVATTRFTRRVSSSLTLQPNTNTARIKI